MKATPGLRQQLSRQPSVRDTLLESHWKDPSSELKCFRRIRAEYARLRHDDRPAEEILQRMEEMYAFVCDESKPLDHDPSFKCPTTVFGRTGLNMSILSLGGMRQQLTWRPKEGVTLADISVENQANFQAIVDRALSLGITHMETARGYGTSELQFGACLKKHPRSTFILQTKISPMEDAEAFRLALEESFQRLQVDRLDLFAFHGVNAERHVEWIFKDGGCLTVVKDYQARGKITHIGFSTHAHTPLIVSVIETGIFDYCNIHYHLLGSYTSSGTDSTSAGNLKAVQAAARHNMGVFIISPSDKGGMLYKPSCYMAGICAEHDITPITLNLLWLWSHDPPIHTAVIGAARPADLDEHILAAKLHSRAAEIVLPISKAMTKRMEDTVGEEWSQTWWKGLPGAYDTDTGVFIPHIVWLWNLVKAYGMWDFARARYATLEGNRNSWDTSKSPQENMLTWSYCPGLPFDPSKDMEPYLSSSPHAEKVLSVLAQAHDWLCAENVEANASLREEMGWGAAYDLQTSIPYPERPSPSSS